MIPSAGHADYLSVNPWEARMQLVAGAFTATFAYTTVRFGNRQARVLVADTPAKRRAGLVGHSDVEGMLFVMERPATAAFHMKHVAEPILIAFFDSEGRLVDVGHMEPQTGVARSARPFAYALELFAGRDAALELLPDLHKGIQVG